MELKSLSILVLFFIFSMIIMAEIYSQVDTKESSHVLIEAYLDDISKMEGPPITFHEWIELID